MSWRRVACAWLLVALLSGAAGTAWAAFSASTESATMTFSVAPDTTAPVRTANAEYREGGGTPQGSIRQGGTYRVYGNFADAGSPQSGVDTVTADLSSFDSGAGQTAVPLTTSGCTPTPCRVDGVDYAYRTAVLTADSPLTSGATYGYSFSITDVAGNVGTSNHSVTIQPYADTVSRTSGLVSHWRLGETAGTAAADAKAANAGTLVGAPTLNQTGALAGDTNKAIKLDGVDDHVTIADSASLDLADGPLTLEAWVRLNDANAGYQNIFNKGTGSWGLAFGNAAGRFVLHKDGTGSVTSFAGTPNTTAYKHFVVTKSGATTKLYVDGTDVTGTVTNQTLVDTALPLMLGRRSSVAEEHLRGWLDEPAVYNQALSAAQVLDHYRAGTGTG